MLDLVKLILLLLRFYLRLADGLLGTFLEPTIVMVSLCEVRRFCILGGIAVGFEFIDYIDYLVAMLLIVGYGMWSLLMILYTVSVIYSSLRELGSLRRRRPLIEEIEEDEEEASDSG